ncbi:hypothetical protein M0D69_16085 [Caballeronia sp. SEWSISQ10-4 2]|uniref:hypothetical protein n=1 Tax=Caballeronia sp. SEWSISQ10-4 2 TaxID=2937438 RepID=UPI002655F78F|nr:hypothetical protein [Caballeronia sp. SEWSISQ10-4 2]MDN7179480.1 hypothetical protein [Caballeronia sp. SEWSISQ10-4 2]
MPRKVPHMSALAEQLRASSNGNGSIPIENAVAVFITVLPQFGAFRRMVRDAE